ncbi:DUF2141 domain-containing protein [Algimonas porphyrae]|uniref:DUF2141 domain-containing protein n=1 Tax=Algimonas porphyrae TaxID=1128113 RepID=A0ABQ5V2U7_9PROT|nr:DUF2141 domain-containing protein [Algimonas porphyrae]GLQ21173.1 hypothetical protein GCM10007854_21280 [Algimonas porphyrae]
MNTKRFITVASALAVSLALPLGGAVKASEFFAAQSQGGAASADLIVKVENIDKTEGQLRIGLYDSETGFEDDRELRGQTVPVTGSTMRIIFDDLPVGRYAIKVFHDQDTDGSLDKDFMGIPSEPYGFSNNASDPFSAPEWKETRFALPRGQMTQSIDLG